LAGGDDLPAGSITGTERTAGARRVKPTHHSELSEVMSADGGDFEAVLEHFAEAGIDTDTLAARLQVSPLSAGSQER